MQYLNKHKTLIFIISSVLYFLFGYFYISGYDIRVYNIPWILEFKNINLLHIYDKTFLNDLAFNYPPILGIIYYIIHKPIIWAYTNNLINLTYLIIKLPFILIHFIILFCLYKMKHEKTFIFWMINPIWIMITAMWGQFDELFCFMIYLLIDMMYHKKYKHIWSLFAIMCLFKHQGAYFVFPLLLYTCVLKLDIYNKLKGFLIGLFIGIMGWLPFIILYKNILYPIKFMLHMMQVNQIISMAVNPWFCMQILFRSSDNIILRYGFVFIIFIIVSLIFIYIKTKDIVLSTYMYMLFLFMFSLGQRERYILYSIIILYYLIYNLNQTQYIKLYKAFNISGIMSLSYFLINTVLPEDVAYASIYIILPIYFVLAIWLLIQTANIINLIFNKPSS